MPPVANESVRFGFMSMDSALEEPGTKPRLQDAARQLLAVVSQLASESSPQRRVAATLDDSLERDLAIDSLARVELMLRIEKGFGVRLPEATMAQAETVRDLLEALRTAERIGPIATPSAPGPEALPLAEPSSDVVPHDATTLVAMLLAHVAHHPDRPHIAFYDEGEGSTTWTYRDLYEAAKKAAAGLRECGIVAGDAVAIMLPTSLDFFATFYAVLFVGGVPVPMYPPARPSQLEDHLRRQADILASCRARALVTVPQVRPLARLIQPNVESLRYIATPPELMQHPASAKIARPRGDDIALLQYTSGSTGNPKGVVLTHANLLANVRAWSERVRVTPDDVVRELAAAVSRHGPDRRLAGQPVLRLPAGADVAAGVSGAPGALALGDSPSPRHAYRPHRTSRSSCCYAAYDDGAVRRPGSADVAPVRSTAPSRSAPTRSSASRSASRRMASPPARWHRCTGWPSARSG